MSGSIGEADVAADLKRWATRPRLAAPLELQFRTHIRREKRVSRAIYYLLSASIFIISRLFGSQLFHTPPAIQLYFHGVEMLLAPLCMTAAMIEWLRLPQRLATTLQIGIMLVIWSGIVTLRLVSGLQSFYFPPSILGVAMVGAAMLCGFSWRLITAGIVVAGIGAMLVELRLPNPQPVVLMNLLVDAILATLAVVGAFFDERLHRRLWRQARTSEILARTDALTGLATRGEFNRRFVQIFAQARRESAMLAVMLIDIDHFKAVNDTYGHLYGDEVLRTFGAALQRAPARRPLDIRARYGGEELLIAWYGVAPSAITELVEQVFAEVKNLTLAAPNSSTPAPRVSISAGISYAIPRGDMKPEALLRKSDALLYKAKRLGRDCYFIEPLSLD